MVLPQKDPNRFRCSVSACISPGYSFHRFPRDKHLREQWIKACHRDVPFNSESARICSRHFEKRWLERNLKAELMLNYGRCSSNKVRRLLKLNAIPTLHLLPEDQAETTDESRNESQNAKIELISSLRIDNVQSVDTGGWMEPPSDVFTSTMSDNIDDKPNTKSVSSQADLFREEVLRWRKEKKRLRMVISRQEKKIASLENSSKGVSKRREAEMLRTTLQKWFTPSQISVLLNKKDNARPKNWTEEDVQKALAIKSMTGDRIYNYILKTLPMPMPHLSTLRNWVSKRNNLPLTNEMSPQDPESPIEVSSDLITTIESDLHYLQPKDNSRVQLNEEAVSKETTRSKRPLEDDIDPLSLIDWTSKHLKCHSNSSDCSNDSTPPNETCSPLSTPKPEHDLELC